MEDLVLKYVDTNFNPYIGRDIKNIFSIFNLFKLDDYEDDLYNLLMTDNIDPNTLQDEFIGIINTKIGFILINHTLSITRGVTLETCYQLLSSLYLLQDLNDYSAVKEMLTIHEAENTLFKICVVISMYCSLDVSSLMSIIINYDSSLLSKIEELINRSETIQIVDDVAYQEQRFVNETEKQFSKYLGFDTLGINMLKKGFKTGYELKYYLNFVKDGIMAIDNESLDKGMNAAKIIASNIISLFLFTNEYNVIMKEDNYKEKLIKAINEKLPELVYNVSDNLKANIVEQINGFNFKLEDLSLDTELAETN